MNPQKFLTVILFFLITVFSSLKGFTLESNSGKKVFNYAYSETFAAGYTYVEVLINGEWWVQVYNEKGMVVDEYPIE